MDALLFSDWRPEVEKNPITSKGSRGFADFEWAERWFKRDNTVLEKLNIPVAIQDACFRAFERFQFKAL
jgi:hypothetical protein